jgi:HTH-type transcriptional regulator / antitoxin HigA
MSGVLDFRRPHLLRDEHEYDAAVAAIDRLLDADPRPGTPDHEKLEFLSVLVEDYEDRTIPQPGAVSPAEAVDFMLDQRNLTRAHLHVLMGGRSRVSEFFSGKRALSRGQIAALRDFLRIPADLLLGA